MEQQIGKYQILGKIGQGAMGEVFKALDPVLNRMVAVKTLAGSVASDSELRRRFIREAQSAARLNHPNIITIFDFGDEGGRAYIAMELLEGKDLRELISGRGFKSLDEKLDVMEQVCDGLAFAHAKDIVHRDLKPGNIHLQPDRTAKIMDFGLARLGGSEMTRTGMIMGTPNYMSPEQVRGEKADARSDVFALGATYYELLASKKPFDADSMHSVLFHVLQDEPTPLSSLVPDLPPVVAQVVERALRKDPARRFQNAGEMAEAVRRARQALAEGRFEAEPEEADEHGDAAHVMVRGQAVPGRGAVGRVEGSAALAVAEDRVPRTSRPPTLSGRTSTQVGRRAPAAGGTSLWMALAGGLVVLAALGGGAIWMMRPKPAPAPPAAPAGDAKVDALTRALVANQVELAKKNLRDKDYKAAVRQAELALRLEPQNADARQVLDEGKKVLDQLDAAAKDARAAAVAGRYDAAVAALWTVMTIQPAHPLAEELASPLKNAFRPRAEEARKIAADARAAAEKANAGTLEAFTRAVGASTEAEAVFKKGDFVAAGRRFLEARDGFERARRSTEG